MIKLKKINFLSKFKIYCLFNNGEKKVLDLKFILKDKYGQKIMKEKIFKTAKIGDLGEIYWAGIAEIKELDGIITPCNYDMSAEFVYENSKTHLSSFS